MEKTLEEFYWKIKKEGIKQNICITCSKIKSAEHYKKNKNKYKESAKRNKKKENQKRKDLINELRKDGCVVCGEKRIPVLVFHHLEPKEKEYTIGRLSSRKKILEEILEICKKVPLYPAESF